MRASIRCAFSALTFVAALAAGPVQAASLVLATEDDNAPYNFTDPQTKTFTGLSTDILAEMMKRAGVTYDLQVLPWPRAYALAQEQANTCLYSTNVTDERKPLFKWVGPLLRGGWALFAKADSPIGELKSLDEAKQYHIGTRIGDAADQYVRNLGGFITEPVPEHNMNAKKLQNGRIDLWLTGAQSGPYEAKQAGIKIKQVFTVRQSELSLACNKAVPDDLIQALNTTFAAMENDGALDAIVAKYR
jgi:polar amino acid transport system substrate-binding protein